MTARLGALRLLGSVSAETAGLGGVCVAALESLRQAPARDANGSCTRTSTSGCYVGSGAEISHGALPSLDSCGTSRGPALQDHSRAQLGPMVAIVGKYCGGWSGAPGAWKFLALVPSSSLGPGATQRSSSSSSSSSSSDSSKTSAAPFADPESASSSAQQPSTDAAHRASADDSSPGPGPDKETDPTRVVLAAAMPFVLECGWTEAAMLEGARAAGLSPSVLALLPRREAHLVEYFMDECRMRMEQESHARASELLSLDDLGSRLQLVVRLRLEQQALYTSTWAQALSIQALPSNLPRTVEQRLQLVAALWSAAGERTRSALEARMLCTMLGAVYTASELFMLTDFSAGYEDTWQFVQRRVTESLQAYSGVNAAQEQFQKVSGDVLKQLGLMPPVGPWGGLRTPASSPAPAPPAADAPTASAPPFTVPTAPVEGSTRAQDTPQSKSG